MPRAGTAGDAALAAGSARACEALRGYSASLHATGESRPGTRTLRPWTQGNQDPQERSSSPGFRGNLDRRRSAGPAPVRPAEPQVRLRPGARWLRALPQPAPAGCGCCRGRCWCLGRVAHNTFFPHRFSLFPDKNNFPPRPSSRFPHPCNYCSQKL